MQILLVPLEYAKCVEWLFFVECALVNIWSRKTFFTWNLCVSFNVFLFSLFLPKLLYVIILSINNNICHYSQANMEPLKPSKLYQLYQPSNLYPTMLKTDLIPNIVHMVHICVVLGILLIVRGSWWVLYNKMA